MEFRLTFDGALLGASRTNTRAAHKHEIRKIFHRQLKRLWATSRTLRAKPPTFLATSKSDHDDLPDHTVDSLAARFTRHGHRFVPLVTRSLYLHCGLDILFMRPEEPGSVIQSGDIDNRIKTLFDALRIPHELAELGGYNSPDIDEDPFFCLLEDDSLISRVSVETDVLLEDVEGGIAPRNQAKLIIKARVVPSMILTDNTKFL